MAAEPKKPRPPHLTPVDATSETRSYQAGYAHGLVADPENDPIDRELLAGSASDPYARGFAEGFRAARDTERLRDERAQTLREDPNAGAKLLADRTEGGAADYLVALAGHILLWDERRRMWLVFNGVAYRLDESLTHARVAERTMRTIYDVAKEMERRADDDDALAGVDDGDLQGENRQRRAALAMRRFAKSVRGQAKLNKILLFARAKFAARDAFDHDPNVLGVANGVLELTDGSLREARRADRLTRQSPVTYTPEATCPTWLAFLERIFAGDNELISFIQRAIGYSLTGRTDEQCFFVCYGSGANGKSTLLRVMRALLATYAQTSPAATFLASNFERASNDLAGMHRKRLVITTEPHAGRTLDDSLIKQVTGEDEISARFLHREYFSFTPQFKLWIAANHRPRVTDTSEAMWRRVNLVPFNVTIPPEERDPELFGKLAAELAGILNWALVGTAAWYRAGLRPPAIVKAATAEYKRENRPVEDFIAQCCVEREDEMESATALYQAYETWAAGGDSKPVSQNAFGRELTRLGFESIPGLKVRSRLGLRLKPDP